MVCDAGPHLAMQRIILASILVLAACAKQSYVDPPPERSVAMSALPTAPPGFVHLPITLHIEDAAAAQRLDRFMKGRGFRYHMRPPALCNRSSDRRLKDEVVAALCSTFRDLAGNQVELAFQPARIDVVGDDRSGIIANYEFVYGGQSQGVFGGCNSEARSSVPYSRITLRQALDVLPTSTYSLKIATSRFYFASEPCRLPYIGDINVIARGIAARTVPKIERQMTDILLEQVQPKLQQVVETAWTQFASIRSFSGVNVALDPTSISMDPITITGGIGSGVHACLQSPSQFFALHAQPLRWHTDDPAWIPTSPNLGKDPDTDSPVRQRCAGTDSNAVSAYNYGIPITIRTGFSFGIAPRVAYGESIARTRHAMPPLALNSAPKTDYIQFPIDASVPFQRIRELVNTRIPELLSREHVDDVTLHCDEIYGTVVAGRPALVIRLSMNTPVANMSGYVLGEPSFDAATQSFTLNGFDYGFRTRSLIGKIALHFAEAERLKLRAKTLIENTVNAELQKSVALGAQCIDRQFPVKASLEGGSITLAEGPTKPGWRPLGVFFDEKNLGARIAIFGSIIASAQVDPIEAMAYAHERPKTRNVKAMLAGAGVTAKPCGLTAFHGIAGS